MPALPFSVYERPFAVDPLSRLMVMPDGIFNTSLGEQLVGVYYTIHLLDPAAWGLEFEIRQIAFTFEVSAESGIVIPLHATGITWPGPPYVPQQHLFSTAALRPGHHFLRFFKADFSRAIPGKHRLRFRATIIPTGGDMVDFPSWDIYQHVFVMCTSLNRESRTFDGTCSEGTLSAHLNSMHVFPFLPAGHAVDEWPMLSMKCIVWDPVEQLFLHPAVQIHPPLMLLKEITLTIVPRKPFRGTHGDLPFSDPLWKLIGLGIIAIGLLVGGGVAIYYAKVDEKQMLAEKYSRLAATGQEQFLAFREEMEEALRNQLREQANKGRHLRQNHLRSLRRETSISYSNNRG